MNIRDSLRRIEEIIVKSQETELSPSEVKDLVNRVSSGRFSPDKIVDPDLDAETLLALRLGNRLRKQ